MATTSYITHPQGSTSLAHLSSCIASVEVACQTLEDSNVMLAEQTSDFARMATILRSKRHFDLVSETDIRRAREHLQAEIAPQLKELILRAEASMQNDDRRSKTLKSKAAQQTARLEQLAQLHHIHVEDVRKAAAAARDNTLVAGTIDSASPGPSSATKAAADATQLEIERLRATASSLHQKRRAMQRDLAVLEDSQRTM